MIGRYLVARSWDVRAAFEQLETALKWRNDFRADSILDNEDPLEAFYQRCCPHLFKGLDYEGRPVYWERTGAIDLPEVLKVSTLDEMRRRHVWGMELKVSFFSTD